MSSSENRVLTSEEREARKQQVFWESQKQGIKGSLLTGLGAIGVHLLGEKFVPVYRSINWRFKLFVGSSAAVAGYWINAEQSHLEKMAVIAEDDDRRRQAADDAFRSSKASKLK